LPFLLSWESISCVSSDVKLGWGIALKIFAAGFGCHQNFLISDNLKETNKEDRSNLRVYLAEPKE
jgi:hypothetical protein